VFDSALAESEGDSQAVNAANVSNKTEARSRETLSILVPFVKLNNAIITKNREKINKNTL
ncbi:MAG: hypothetical protein K2M51_05805, partial [Helicobacter sp.]|nr:hypothetical protein [Helicobacter sp.]